MPPFERRDSDRVTSAEPEATVELRPAESADADAVATYLASGLG